MSESRRLAAFAEDLEVFHQLTTSEERAEFTHLMKRAYAQHISACAFVQRSPERQVSARIRHLCESALSRASRPDAGGTADHTGGESKDGTNIAH